MSPRLDRLLQKQRQKSASRVSDPIVAPIVAITAPMKTNAAGAARGGGRLYGKRSPANGIFRERQRGFVGPASSHHDDRLLEDAESDDLHALGASGADAASIEIPIDLDVHHHVRRNTCLGRFRRAISNFIRAKRGSYIASNPGSSSTHWTLARGNKHETEGRSGQILRTNSHGMMPLGALQLGQKFLHHPKRDLGHHPQGVFQKWEISF
jgi:hypothetical protein